MIGIQTSQSSKREFSKRVLAKRGQVTVFIILGIIILAITASILFITNTTISSSVESEGRPIIESVPQQFIALQEYTESCLASTTKRAFQVLGQQGGYIDPSFLGEFSPTQPTESVGVSLNGLRVPYWHHNAIPSEDPAILIESLQPELESESEQAQNIEDQVARYVEQELDNCLQDYEVFSQQSFEISQEAKEVEVRVFDGHVDVILEMPLQVSRAGSQTSMEIFYADLAFDFKAIYELAQQITDTQFNSTFLENQAINLIEVYSGENINKLPPTNSISFGQDTSLFWTATQARQRLKELLTSYVPTLRYQGSANFYRFEYPFDSSSDLYQRVYDNMIIPLDGAEDYAVSFDYFAWEPFVSINGGQEEITPQLISYDNSLGVIPFRFSQQKFYNTYDLSYPVLVSIEDPAAFNGDGYTFTFALEANVVNNRPFDPQYVQPPTQIAPQQSLACDPDQQITQPIGLTIFDASTQEPVDLVSVNLEIPGIDRCVVGATDESGQVAESFPPLYGGLLELSREGYLTEYYSIDTFPYLQESGDFGYEVEYLDAPVIELYPEKTLDLRINKIPLQKCLLPRSCNLERDSCQETGERICFFNSGNGLFLNEPVTTVTYNGSISGSAEYYTTAKTDLLETEQVLVSFERISDVDSPVQADDFIQYVTVTGSQATELSLVPGVYEVSATVILNQEILIPADERCNSANRNQCTTFDSITADGNLVGQLAWNTTSTYLTVTSEQLYGSSGLELTVFSQEWDQLPETTASVDQQGDEIEINARLLEDLTVATLTRSLSTDPRYQPLLEERWVAGE